MRNSPRSRRRATPQSTGAPDLFEGRFSEILIIFVLALIVLGCPNRPLAAQEVYKSVDAQGHVVYSDRGVSKGAARTDVPYGWCV